MWKTVGEIDDWLKDADERERQEELLKSNVQKCYEYVMRNLEQEEIAELCDKLKAYM